MELVHSQGWNAAPLQGPARAARIRPGERPAWVELPVGRRWWPVWRRSAQEQNLPVDAWIAACLELHAVTASFAEPSRGREALERAAAAGNRHAYIAPTEELRQWSLRLVGRGFPPPKDELPTVVLPQRVLSRWLPRLAIPDLTPEDGHLALACERAAAVRGMTLETWALTALLADRAY